MPGKHAVEKKLGHLQLIGAVGHSEWKLKSHIPLYVYLYSKIGAICEELVWTKGKVKQSNTQGCSAVTVTGGRGVGGRFRKGLLQSPG